MAAFGGHFCVSCQCVTDQDTSNQKETLPTGP